MFDQSRGDAAHGDCGTGALILIDDQELTRACLADIFRRANFKVLALGHVDEHVLSDVEKVRNCRMVLLNIKGGDLHDARIKADVRKIVQLLPWAPLAVLAAQCGIDPAMDAVRQGVRGYLAASTSAGDLIAAVRLIMAGGIFIGRASGQPEQMPSAVAPVAQEDEGGPDGVEEGVGALPLDVPGTLTPREGEVLDLLREGKPNKIIAFELKMAENTVKIHVRRILKKLHATNRTEAAFTAAAMRAAVPDVRGRHHVE
ncbi:MAG: response regulator transcription factor [Rhodospirillaceae bacterium]